MSALPHPQDREQVTRWVGPDAHVLQPGVALVHADARTWLANLPECSIHAVVTDPPYGWSEYEPADLEKLRKGRGGVWRKPPTLDGVERRPVPRFTVLKEQELQALSEALQAVAALLIRALVPGGHVFVASTPLLSHRAFDAFAASGLERRATVMRGVQTLRGGDRPKGAHLEFPEVSVMPRGCWEPWGCFRKELQGTVAENLRRWGTGGLRRPARDEPFKDWIASSPTHHQEKKLAAHPSLKPQHFVRQLVRASLPLGRGIVLDPFAGSGSTLAAAAHLGYAAIGVERDPDYIALATTSFEALRDL